MDHPRSVNEISALEWRRRIEHEDDLISNRVSWLIGSQAFLIAAFVALHTDVPLVSRDESQQYLSIQHEDFSANGLISYLIIVIGATVSFGSFLGYLGAIGAIDVWRRNMDAETRNILSCGKCWEFFGGVTGFVIGPLLTAVWLLLLKNEFSHIFKNLGAFEVWTPIIILILFSIAFAIYSFSDRMNLKTQRAITVILKTEPKEGAD